MLVTQLEAHLGNQLEDNWGLDTLVRVGETWLPRMMDAKTQKSASGSCDGTAAAADVPLLKLFEFLTASMCLYVIDDEPPGFNKRDLEAYTMAGPPKRMDR